MNTKHILLATIMVTVLGGSAFWFTGAYFEYKEERKHLAEVELQILLQQQRNEDVLLTIDRLKNDPHEIEKVARNKFRWCRPFEKVYDFSAAPIGISSTPNIR